MANIIYNKKIKLRKYDDVLRTMNLEDKYRSLIDNGQINIQIYNLEYEREDMKSLTMEVDGDELTFEDRKRVAEKKFKRSANDFYLNYGNDEIASNESYKELLEYYRGNNKSISDEILKKFIREDMWGDFRTIKLELKKSLEYLEAVEKVEYDFLNTGGHFLGFYKNNGELAHNMGRVTDDNVFSNIMFYNATGTLNKNLLGVAYIGNGDYQRANRFMKIVKATIADLTTFKIFKGLEASNKLIKSYNELNSYINLGGYATYETVSKIAEKATDISEKAREILKKFKIDGENINEDGLTEENRKVIAALGNISTIGSLLNMGGGVGAAAFIALNLKSGLVDELESEKEGKLTYQQYIKYVEENNEGLYTTGLTNISVTSSDEPIEYDMNKYGFTKVKADGSTNTIIGTSGGDYIEVLTESDNKLLGNDGNDVLIGARVDQSKEYNGNDEFWGGQGNDTFIYMKNGGIDTIMDEYLQADKNDTLLFPDIEKDEVEIYREEKNLVIRVKNSDDNKLIIQNHFVNAGVTSSNSVEYVKFASNDKVRINDLIIDGLDNLTGGDNLNGSDSLGEFIYGNGGNDYIYGNGENDTLYGDDFYNNEVGNDHIFGGSGDDTLYGGNGNDHLYGGIGTDTLNGGSGDDTYYVHKGDGITIINEASGKDVLDLSDFNFKDVDITTSNNRNLYIKSIDQDSENSINVTITNFFTNYNIESVIFKNQKMDLKNAYFLKKKDSSENQGVDQTTEQEKKGQDSSNLTQAEEQKNEETSRTLSVNTNHDHMSYSRNECSLIINAHDGKGNIIDTQNVDDFFSESNNEYTPNNNKTNLISFADKKDVNLSEIWITGIIEGWIKDEQTGIKVDTIPDPVVTDNPDENKISIGDPVYMGVISERESNAGRITGHMINEKALYKFTDIGELVLGEHTSANPKWNWVTGTEADKSDSRVEFSYGGNNYKLYVNTGSLVKNNQTVRTSKSDLVIGDSKTMISQEYINEIFGLQTERENGKVYSIDDDKNAERYSDLYDISLTNLDKGDLEDVLDNLSKPSTAVNSDVIGIGNTVVISKELNNYAFELMDTSYIYKTSSGASRGTKGYELNKVLSGFKHHVSVKQRKNNYYHFTFGEKDIIVDHTSDKPVTTVNGAVVKVDAIPGMKNNKLIISTELFEELFDLKKDRRVVSNKEGTQYYIDEGSTISGFANVLGNEFYYDAEDGKFVVTKKYGSTTSINSALDNVVDRYHEIRDNTGGGDGGNFSTAHGRDRYEGTDDDETIDGDDKSNRIYGLGGDDIIEGDDGSDKIYGGDGNDEIEGGNDRDKLYGEDGNDDLDGGNDRDYLYGGDGNDLLYGNDGKDSLFGDDGDDVFESSEGFDLYKGGRGSDIYSIDDESVRINDIEYTGEDGKPDTGIDTVLFHETNWNEIRLVKDENDLHVLMDPNDDTKLVEIDYYFSDESYRPEQYAFVENDLIVTNRDLMDKFVEQNGSVINSGSTSATYVKGQGRKELETFSTAYNLTIHKSTTINMGEIKSSDVEIMTNKSKSDLIISVNGTDDYMVVKDYFMSEGSYVDSLKFAGGETWNKNTLLSKADKSKIYLTNTEERYQTNRNEIEDHIRGNATNNKIWTYGGNDTIEGGAGDDQLFGGTGSDRLEGGSGEDLLFGGEDNDTLYGNANNDTLDGGVGNDHLYGGEGNDTIIGGAGNDQLYGGSGENVYKFSKGFGNDVIHIDDANSSDVIAFEDVNSEDVLLERQGDNLIVSMNDTADTITITNCFVMDRSKLKAITFANHITISEEQLLKTPTRTVGSDSADNLVGSSYRDSIFGNEGDDTIDGGLNNDELYGGHGKDKLYGGQGDDYLSGGLDNDRIDGGIGNDTISGGGHNDYLIGNEGEDKLLGGSGNDVMEGNEGNDTLIGGTGIDSLFGDSGNDLLVGGEHNDYLEGGLGNDTYLFKRGFGQDTIGASSNHAFSDFDTIQFEDINSDDVTLERDRFNKEDLLIKVNYSSDEIRVKNYYTSNISYVDAIKFADNVTWDKDAIEKNAKILVVQNGASGNDTLIGKDQEDTVDVLYGLEGDDVLKGNAYNDELHGGAGNDLLEGGAGNDVYKFARGFGKDTIITSTSQGHADGEYVEFTDIESTEVTLGIDSDNKNDLIISVNNTDDSIRVKDYFSSPDSYLDNIVFSDRVLWNKEEIMKQVQLVFNGTNNDDQLEGYTEVYNTLNYSETFHGKAGNDSILAHKGNDMLYGDEGNDHLDGGEGNDMIYGGEDNDTLIGGTGDDHLVGGLGSDVYKFARGFGSDTVITYSENRHNGIESFDFTDINSDEVVFEASDVDRKSLLIKVKGSNDVIKIQNYYSDSNALIDSITFADGVVWNKETVDNYASEALVINGSNNDDTLLGTKASNYTDEIHGLSGSDMISGFEGNDKLFGDSGNDTLYGHEGDDVLEGGSNSDTLYGGLGNDTLRGGTDKDLLTGGSGNDQYVFAKGFGQDTVISYTGDKHNDGEAIVFDDILLDEVTFKYDSVNQKDLILSVNGSNDTITIKDYFSNASAYIDSYTFSDGKVLKGTELSEKIKNDITIHGTLENDTINGYKIDDVIYGKAGNDTIRGNEGNDLIDGGSGNDILIGGTGNDTYRFAKGFGEDTLITYDESSHNAGEKIIFEDISMEEIIFKVDKENQSDLLLEVKSTNDAIRIKDYFTNVHAYVDRITFENNQELSGNLLKQKIIDDITIHGTGANDTITGAAINDFIYGKSGNDIISGQAGDDFIQGDTGNDVLTGGTGNDIYKFFKGFGKDTVITYDASGHNNGEKIIFGDVKSSEITFEIEGDNSNNLLIKMKESEDFIRVDNYFGSQYAYVDAIEFSDNVVWNKDNIHELVTAGTNQVTGTSNNDTLNGESDGEVADVIKGLDGNDTLNGYDGNDKLYGDDGYDTLYGGSGNDKLYGGNDNDKLYGESGHDYMVGGAGSDTLEGGSGNDTLHGTSGSNTLKGDDGNDTLYGGTYTDSLYGGNHNDKLYGGSGNDILYGEAGIDHLDGGAGNDTLQGGNDNDTLKGGSENDHLYGQHGNDTMYGGTGNDYLNGDIGDDLLVGDSGDDNLYGGAGNDTYKFSKGFGNDTVTTMNGNTHLDGEHFVFTDIKSTEVYFEVDPSNQNNLYLKVRGTNDSIRVLDYFGKSSSYIDSMKFSDNVTWDRAGIDVAIGKSTLVINGTSGNDVMTGYDVSGYSEEIHGQSGHDTIRGQSGNDKLYGDAGYDTLYGGSGNDKLYGGNDNDKLYGDSGNDYLEGGTGIDCLYGGNSQDTLYGGAGNDELNGDAGNDYLNGDEGNDSLRGGTGLDTLEGGSGNDTLQGGNDNDTLKGGSENDHLYGQHGNDTMYGGTGNDYLNGDIGDDLLVGDSGDDNLYGGAGNDTYKFSKGFGNDTVTTMNGNTHLDGEHFVFTDIKSTEVYFEVDPSNQNNLYLKVKGTNDSIRVLDYFGKSSSYIDSMKFSDNVTWDRAGIDVAIGKSTLVINGTSGNDVMTGYDVSGYSEEIHGQSGHDTIRGQSGNDKLYGDAGYDTLYGGSGNDKLYGGNDNDKLYGDSGNDYLEGGTGIDCLYGGNSQDTLYGGAGNDELNGDAGNDYLNGDEGNDSLRGGTGLDTLEGGSGNDTLQGGNDNDTLKGGSENDHLYGQHGNDTMYGGTGNDYLNGDIGDDLLVGDSGDDNLYGGAGNDTYKFSKGFGNDTVTTMNGNTHLDGEHFVFTDIKSTEVYFEVDPSNQNNLYLKVKGTNDSIRVLDYFGKSSSYIDSMKFSDNVTWDRAGIDVAIGKSTLVINGTSGNDVMTGYDVSGYSEEIHGQSGHDTIRGQSGNDKLYGDAGYDTLYGGSGNDKLYGGNDNDKLYGESGHDYMVGGAGSDTLEGGSGNDTLHGTSGSNTLKGDDGNDTLYGGTYTDSLYGGNHNDKLYGGSGNDTLYGEAGIDYLEGGSGNDTLQGGNDNDTLKGGSENDHLYGQHGNDTMYGGTGNDYLNGDIGDDLLVGDSGDDNLYGGAGNDTYKFSKGFGNDTVTTMNGNTHLDGEHFVFTDIKSTEVYFEVDPSNQNNLYLKVKGTNDSIRVLDYFGKSSSYIDSMKFSDNVTWDREKCDLAISNAKFVINGTNGNDVITGSQQQAFSEEIHGQSGHDTLRGLSGNDVLYGDAGYDTLYGGSGNDKLYGGNDNDKLYGESGHDYMVGGAGSDTLEGGSGNDTLHGTSGSNTLKGDDGNDTLYGGTYTDSLYGGNHNDKLYGGSGNDILYGEAGIDHLDGGAGNDTLQGGNDNDTLKGGSENDHLYGQHGNDTMYGGTGNDYLNGDIGDDLLVGDSGDDNLYGGAGNDTYKFSKGFGNDTVTTMNGNTHLDGEHFVFTDIKSTEVYFEVDPSNQNNLYLKVRGTNDSIRVLDYFGKSSSYIDSMKFSDNVTWDRAGIDVAIGKSTLVINGTSGNDVMTGYDVSGYSEEIHGQSGHDTIRGQSGNDKLYGDAGYDTLYGGSGNDKLYGGNDNDKLYGESGHDYMVGGAGSDTLEGGSGNDTLHGTSGSNTLKGDDGNDTLYGGTYTDSLYGGNHNDKLYGGSGNDALYGEAGIDYLDGGAGNDTLQGGNDNDTLKGGSENDHLYGQHGNDTMYGGTGNDYLNGDIGDDLLVGDSGDDNLYGGAGNDTYKFSKGFGNDTVTTMNGNTHLDGEHFVFTDIKSTEVYFEVDPSNQNNLYLKVKGTNDSIRVLDYFGKSSSYIDSMKFSDNVTWDREKCDLAISNAKFVINGTNGNDVITGSQQQAFSEEIHGQSGHDTLRGLSGNDVLYGDAGYDTLYGGSGNDKLYGGNDNDKLYGESGHDYMVGGAGSDTLEGGSGNDTLHGTSGSNTLKGDDGNDTLYGGTYTDSLYGGNHNDKLYGGSGNDTLYGEAGIDYLDGGSGNDTLQGGNDNDILKGGSENDHLYGQHGNDTMYGGTGNDYLNGDIGDDLLVGDSGDDNLYGGAGNDTYKFSKGFGNDTVTTMNGNTHLDGEHFVFTDIKSTEVYFEVDPSNQNNLYLKVKGTNDSIRVLDYFGKSSSYIDSMKFSDNVTWDREKCDLAISNAKFVINGTNGNDVITGSQQQAFSEEIHGQSGHDTLRGLSGNDVLYGDVGYDTLYGGSGNDKLYGGNDNDKLYGESGHDYMVGGAGSDTLEGGSGNDTLHGTSGSNTLKGDDGNDTLYGGTYTDSLYGGNHNDKLYGGSGNDTLYGEAGIDYLDGGAGNDTLQGGNDNDTLKGGSENDHLYGQHGNDTMYGGTGNDYLNGDIGDDLLVGDSGDDNLYGGAGNDTYKFSKGFGNDTVTTMNGNTHLDGEHFVFTDIKSTEVYFEVDPSNQNNLYLKVRGTNDSIRVLDYFGKSSSYIDSMKFSDNVTWDRAGIDVAIGKSTLVINGTSGNDVMTGYDISGYSEEIHGQSGHDTIRGQSGNDKLYGDAGYDTLYGGSGNDKLYGGNDNDKLYGESGHDYMVGGAGSDTLEGGSGNDTLHGTSGSNTLKGDDGNDTLYGGTYTDSLYGGNHNDKLYGGSGNDTLYGEAGIDYLDGGAGNDTLQGGNDNDTLKGGSENDHLYGQHGNDTMYGGTGNDYLNGDIGDDLLVGDSGDDNLYGGAGNDTYKFSKGFGNDTVTTMNGNTHLDGEHFVFTDIKSTEVYFEVDPSNQNNLYLKVKGTNDSIRVLDYFGKSSSYIDSMKFSDNVTWDRAGIDVAIGKSTLVINGTSGNDVMTGYDVSGYSEEIHGQSGHDTIRGQSGNDKLYGDAGYDTLYGGSGNDKLYGGNDNDKLYGESGHDYMVGGAGSDTLEGGSGNDTLHGTSGSNTLKGDDGNDTLYGGTYTDSLYGGNHNDKLYGGSGNDTLYGEAGIDHLDGGAGNDTLQGGNDNDTLKGGSENDHLYGQHGNDTMYGGTGNDYLNGDIGDDLLVGDSGDDNLYGGAGNDTYKFSKGFGQDTINNNDSSGTDKIQMSYDYKDLVLKRENNNLKISTSDNNSINISNYYSSSKYKIDAMNLNNNVSITSRNMELLIQAMASYCSSKGVSWTSELSKNNQEVQTILSQYYTNA